VERNPYERDMPRGGSFHLRPRAVRSGDATARPLASVVGTRPESAHAEVADHQRPDEHEDPFLPTQRVAEAEEWFRIPFDLVPHFGVPLFAMAVDHFPEKTYVTSKRRWMDGVEIERRFRWA
jgi:hypothetical protein